MKIIYECEYCGKQFDSKEAFKEHEAKCRAKRAAEKLIKNIAVLINLLAVAENITFEEYLDKLNKTHQAITESCETNDDGRILFGDREISPFFKPVTFELKDAEYDKAFWNKLAGQTITTSTPKVESLDELLNKLHI